jgi:hypothetical protein
MALSLASFEKNTGAAELARGAEAQEILQDPNVLLSDAPTADLSLQKRRLGDPSQSSAQPFGEFVDFPYRYGVTNGKITSMVCIGDALKSLDVEPTAIGLQMRLGKADLVEEGHDELTLFWFTRKRAAAVSGEQIKWFAVYK